jgi:uncharacterized protein (TIGR02588 family)
LSSEKRVTKTSRAALQTAPLLEWIVGALGAALFFGIVGVALHHGATDKGAPPSISAAVERIEPVPDGYVVTFEARNHGDITAAQVRLVARLTTPTGAEEHEAVLDFVPPQSARRGGFFFENDPRAGVMRIAADGYQDP